MKLTEFSMGLRFFCADREYQVTDIGTRTVLAIPVDRPDWMAGPPYAIAEFVFDEDDLPVCYIGGERP